jgi:hypothetical protein
MEDWLPRREANDARQALPDHAAPGRRRMVHGSQERADFLLGPEAIASGIASFMKILEQARELSQFIAAARAARNLVDCTHISLVRIEVAVEDAQCPDRLRRQLPRNDTVQRVDGTVAAPSDHASRFEIREATRYEASL